MMWEYVRFDDDTQTSYSDVREGNTVLVAIERPKDWGFDTAKCLLPAYLWTESDGFSEANLEQLDEFVHNNAPRSCGSPTRGAGNMPSLFRIGHCLPYLS